MDTYNSPICHVLEMCADHIICASLESYEEFELDLDN